MSRGKLNFIEAHTSPLINWLVSVDKIPPLAFPSDIATALASLLLEQNAWSYLVGAYLLPSLQPSLFTRVPTIDHHTYAIDKNGQCSCNTFQYVDNPARATLRIVQWCKSKESQGCRRRPSEKSPERGRFCFARPFQLTYCVQIEKYLGHLSQAEACKTDASHQVSSHCHGRGHSR